MYIYVYIYICIYIYIYKCIYIYTYKKWQFSTLFHLWATTLSGHVPCAILWLRELLAIAGAATSSAQLLPMPAVLLAKMGINPEILGLLISGNEPAPHSPRTLLPYKESKRCLGHQPVTPFNRHSGDSSIQAGKVHDHCWKPKHVGKPSNPMRQHGEADAEWLRPCPRQPLLWDFPDCTNIQ